jgi:putative FmdB family regulatory protein
MPVYDYRCADCGREVEVSHGIHAAGPSTCESCGGPMRKALSAPAIHFKGSGWAKKDARAAAKPALTTPSAGTADAVASASTPAAQPAEATTTRSGGASGAGSGASGAGSATAPAATSGDSTT